ncbi:hypothetical protein Pfo_013092 [Paulownia fortunei]|nr:hypothetical protein Pfo_013092 [Paulownia fortunei]
MELPSFFLNFPLPEICLSFTLLLSFNLTSSVALKGISYPSSFPDNFLFGTASSSYQFEGAILTDGKGLSNWDNFTHSSVCQVTRYIEDIDLMENLGVNSYRFPYHGQGFFPGRFGNVNMAGIDHYSKLIDALLQKGIQPFVTLTHYDIPYELEERYGAWLSPEIRNDFEHYADVCFNFFGNRVKYWVTFNEPNVMAVRGYRSGIYPPSRCSGPYGNCSKGNSEQEPLIAAHNMILCHAAAVNIYRTIYQKEQGGSIGIVMNAIWYEPFSNSTEDKLAAERAQSFYLNWFLDPIMFGKYPEEMHHLLGSLLPVLSKKDLQSMSNRLDFIGINHYTSFYSKDCLYSDCESGAPGVSKSEGYTLRTAVRDGALIGESTDVDWLYVYPQGMEKIVTYIKDRYNNTPMFITENGLGIRNGLNTYLSYFLNDVKRVEYMSSYLDSLAMAIRKGADVRGYLAWSLLDNFEWISGFTIRFGLHHVDYDTLKRTPKLKTQFDQSTVKRFYGFNQIKPTFGFRLNRRSTPIIKIWI